MGPPMASWVDVQAWSVACGLSVAVWEKRVLIHLGYLRASILSEKKPGEK